MAVTDDSKLSRLYKFFNTYGPERMNGLDASYFAGMSPAEQAEAWDFLMTGFPDSVDNITGLYLLNKMRAIEQFKLALDQPMPESEFAAEQRETEIDRLLMLRYVTNNDPDPRYIAMLANFAGSKFESVRTQFAQSLSNRNATPDNINALKGMIFTETERLPLASAILALMELHGVSSDPDDPEHRATYMSLRSGAPDDKLAAMNRLEAMRPLMGA
ncbi:MAG: hypothetical protein AB1437_13695 [Pseudomonadota bacterium]